MSSFPIFGPTRTCINTRACFLDLSNPFHLSNSSKAFHHFVKIARGETVRGWRWFKRNLMFGKALTRVLRRHYKSFKDTDVYLMGLLEKPHIRNGRRTHVLGPTYAGWSSSDFSL